MLEKSNRRLMPERIRLWILIRKTFELFSGFVTSDNKKSCYYDNEKSKNLGF